MAAPDQDRGDLVDALAQLSWLVSAQITAAAAEHELSTSQLRLLGILRDREPEMQELARHLGLDKSSVTGLVTRAESRGLVERVAGEGDRRTVLVRLTAQGHALAAALEREVHARLGPVIDAIPAAERDGLVRLVDLIRGT